MNLSNGPSGFELALIPESRIEQIAEKLDEPEHLGSDAFFALVDEVKTTVYRCPSCGRIHVDGGNGLFKSFVPESLV
jgi:rubrerythrin